MKEERAIRVPTTGVSDFESLVTDETKKYVDETRRTIEAFAAVEGLDAHGRAASIRFA